MSVLLEITGANTVKLVLKGPRTPICEDTCLLQTLCKVSFSWAPLKCVVFYIAMDVSRFDYMIGLPI